MKKIHAFEASDGTTFVTSEECKHHEELLFVGKLCELSRDQVSEALNRTDADLADAFERAGNIIGDKRRKSGDLRRKTPDMKAEASVNKTMDKLKKNMMDVS